MLCPLTGVPHRLFWLRSAWWCEDCRQKIETCCEGACPSASAEAVSTPRGALRSGSAVREGLAWEPKRPPNGLAGL
jgi:hypothetical protein